MFSKDTDSYKTIKYTTNEVLFKDKNSKFFGYAFPIQNEKEVKQYILQLKKKHASAGHWCYAYQLGTENIIYRVNDDGEPNNSAGTPIYGQIQSFELTHTLVVVVRYFGGTKLGVSGLINAYRTTAKMALDKAEIIEKTIDIHFALSLDYKDLSKVMRLLKAQQAEIVSQKLELNCELLISIRKSKADHLFSVFDNFYGISIKTLSQ